MYIVIDTSSHSLYGCHIAVSDVAPGCTLREWQETGREGERMRGGEGQGGGRDCCHWFVVVLDIHQHGCGGAGHLLFMLLHCLSIVIVIVGSGSLLWSHGNGCVFA